MGNGYCVGCGILTWVSGAFDGETVFADGELFIVGSGVDVDCIASCGCVIGGCNLVYLVHISSFENVKTYGTVRLSRTNVQSGSMYNACNAGKQDGT